MSKKNYVVYIGVIGEGESSEETRNLAYEVGRSIARKNAVLVCGGLGGVMESAARGARAAGGTTIGILPGSDRRQANLFIDYAIATGLGEARNCIVARSSDALISVGGGYGTLSEIAFALKFGRPVVGLKSWHIHLEGEARDHLPQAGSPSEAVELALGLMKLNRVPLEG